MNNPEITQAEKRRILIEERRLRTMQGFAAASIDDERGGRFALSDNKPSVTGSTPSSSYPHLPSGPWAKNEMPKEALIDGRTEGNVLGFEIDRPGEPASPSTAAASDVEGGSGGLNSSGPATQSTRFRRRHLMPIIVEAVYEFDDDEAESLLALLCGNLRTEEEMARKMVLDAIDPVIPLGDEFTFEEREPGDFYISLEVPDIGSQVDLIIAWQVAQLDAKACALTLEHDHPLAATLRVYRNSLQWLRFWSVRCPSDVWRKKFAEGLEKLEGGLAELRMKARRTANYEMMNELANV